MKKCQSCAMPMSRDLEGGGSEKNGTKSDIYCSICYGNGAFYYQGDDVKDYQKMVVNKMVENGWWRPVAWLVTREIPMLERWRKTQ